jgi:hypothetical protein
VREPAGVPPWAGAGFKNFGHQLGKKTKQRFVHPLCTNSTVKRNFLKESLKLPLRAAGGDAGRAIPRRMGAADRISV